jgi:hypothetical protein
MGHFRQTPKGIGRNLGENIRRDMVQVSLDDMADTGNRAQRRWAKKKIGRANGKKHPR